MLVHLSYQPLIKKTFLQIPQKFFWFLVEIVPAYSNRLYNLNGNTCIQAGRGDSAISGHMTISEPVDSAISTEDSEVVQVA